MKVDSIMTSKVDYGVGVLRGLLFATKPRKFPKLNTTELGDAIEHIRGAARFVEREQKARFKRRSKANKKTKITTDKKVVTDLASAVLFALKFHKEMARGGTRMVDGKVVSWEETFMAALDGVGYSIDRKQFWADKSKKKGKKR